MIQPKLKNDDLYYGYFLNENKLNFVKNPTDPNAIIEVLIEVNTLPFPDLYFAAIDSGMLIIISYSISWCEIWLTLMKHNNNNFFYSFKFLLNK